MYRERERERNKHPWWKVVFAEVARWAQGGDGNALLLKMRCAWANSARSLSTSCSVLGVTSCDSESTSCPYSMILHGHFPDSVDFESLKQYG